MTFRDDHDAALARVTALDAELARTQAELASTVAERDELREQVEQLAKERDELAAQLAKLKPQPRAKQPKPPKPRAEASQRRKLYMQIALWIAGGAVVIGLFGFLTCHHGKIQAVHEAWQARVAAAAEYKQRWQALIRLEPCVRQTMMAAAGPVAHRHPRVFDPIKQRDHGYRVDSIASNCLDAAKWLVEDPNTSAHVKAPLREWLAVEAKLAAPLKRLSAYEGNADWREDQGAARPQLWQDVMVFVDKRREIIAWVREQVVPELRAELRAIQERHEALAGRDEVWWRMQLGLALWEINELSLDRAGIYAGRWFDEAAAAPHLREPVTALVTAGKQAPIEVRRELRKLEWITQPLVEGKPPRGETPLWHLAHREADLLRTLYHDKIPAIPDPGPEPARPSDD